MKLGLRLVLAALAAVVLTLPSSGEAVRLDGAVTRPSPAPVATRTPPFPVDVSDSSAGTADVVGATRVNILGGTSTTVSCAPNGTAADCTVNASSSIGSSFDLNVEINGTDSTTCGPINAPCAGVSTSNGAFAKITAAQDNGFETCATDYAKGCGRCTDSTLTACTTTCSGGETCIGGKCQKICNENSDCASTNAVCSQMTCSNNTSEACGWSCSTTTARKCQANWDCPPGETCNSTNAASTCASQAGGVCLGGTNNGASCTVNSQCPSGACMLCHMWNTNNRCASGGCYGPEKNYAVRLGAGEWAECWNGATQMPSGGGVSVVGRGRGVSSVTCGQNGGIAFDITNRYNPQISGVGFGVIGTAGVSGSTGNTSGGWFHDCGFSTVGTGWPMSYTGHGNQTVGISDSWMYGFTSEYDSGKGMRIETWPNQVCENDQTRPCDSGTDCASGNCVDKTCSNNFATVCDSDADCSGGKCQGGIKQWHYNQAYGSVATADIGIETSWLQPGTGGGSSTAACMWFDGQATGTPFNVIFSNTVCQISDENTDRSAGSTGLRVSQTASQSTASGFRNRFVVQARDVVINAGIYGSSSRLDRALDLGAGTTLAVTGLVSYDPARRFLSPANGIHNAAKISYLDSAADRWGGGFSGVQSINANEPRSQPVGQNGTPFFAYGTAGSCNASSTAYCYKVTAKTELGEGQASTGACASTPSGSNNKSIDVAWAPVPYATGGFNVYRATTLGGTYTKICGCVGCPACPTGISTFGSPQSALAGYTDTCVGTPSGSIPSTGGPNNDGDTSWAYNSVPGEVWYSETLDLLRANINGVVRPISGTESDVEQCALTSGTCAATVGTNVQVFASDLEAWNNTGRRSLIRAGFAIKSVGSTRDWTCSLRDNGTPVVTRSHDDVASGSFATMTLQYVEDGTGTQGPYNVVCSTAAGSANEVSAGVLTRETL